MLLWPDNDEPGQAHMQQLAIALRTIAASVKFVEWVEAPHHGDAADFIAGGRSAGDLKALFDAAVTVELIGPELESSRIEGDRPQPRRGVSQPSQLVALAASADLFDTPDQEPYATIPVGDHSETVALRSREVKGFLRRRYYDEHGSAAGSRAVDEAIDELEAAALYAGDEHPVFLRVAELDGRQYLDLGDRSWRAIEIAGGV